VLLGIGEGPVRNQALAIDIAKRPRGSRGLEPNAAEIAALRCDFGIERFDGRHDCVQVFRRNVIGSSTFGMAQKEEVQGCLRLSSRMAEP